METFSALQALCAGNSPVPGEFLHKGQWRGALMFSLICARKNGWVNNRDAGDLRRHSAHCDVIVMFLGEITVAEVNGKTAHVWCLHTHVCISSWHAYWSLQNALRWRHNELDGVSDHQPHDCLLNRLFGRRSKRTSKLRVTGLCAGNSPGTGEFSAQMASNAENVSIWWRHHGLHYKDHRCLHISKSIQWVSTQMIFIWAACLI